MCVEPAPGPATRTTFGLVLAGGLSRRLGGGDKPLRTIGGQTMLARVIERLGPQCAGLLLSANGDAARFASFGLPVVADDVPRFAGPLAGLLAGFDWLAARRPDVRWVVSVAGDTPFIPSDLVLRLHAERKAADARLACATSGGRVHPVVALWPVALRHDLRGALVADGLRKVGLFASRYPRALADWPTAPFDPFFNANEARDLVEGERIALHPDASPTPRR